jgi:hypothetical protein
MNVFGCGWSKKIVELAVPLTAFAVRGTDAGYTVTAGLNVRTNYTTIITAFRGRN